ncbi:S-adenosyl-L-methionine-dependent methyltransferase [Xylogone sp. PMI_703]|nr:S-adenosyl-L-methionine-dependent methyltransferase [Xylogone sp. PMI_703]
MASPTLINDDSFHGIAARLRKALDDYEKHLGSANPTIHPNTEPTTQNSEMVKIRGELVDSLERLNALVVDPVEQTTLFSFRAGPLAALAIANQLDLFNVIPLDGTMTLEELSKATGAHEDVLLRHIRLLVSEYILVEVAANTYAHSRLSAPLRNKTHLAFMLLQCQYMSKAVLFSPDYYKKNNHQNIDHPYNSPFQLGYSTHLELFKYAQTNKDFTQSFHTAMEGTQVSTNKALRDSFPFNEALKSGDGKPKIIVDVGGSRGQVMILLKEIWPELDFHAIVQDLPEAFQGLDLKVYPWLEYQIGADIYLLRHILHDWPTSYCEKILHEVVAAMAQHSKLLICDSVVPEVAASKLIIGFDSCVNAGFGGMERTEKQWLDLFSKVDKRLHLVKVWGEPSPEQVLEVILD